MRQWPVIWERWVIWPQHEAGTREFMISKHDLCTVTVRRKLASHYLRGSFVTCTDWSGALEETKAQAQISCRSWPVWHFFSSWFTLVLNYISCAKQKLDPNISKVAAQSLKLLRNLSGTLMKYLFRFQVHEPEARYRNQIFGVTWKILCFLSYVALSCKAARRFISIQAHFVPLRGRVHSETDKHTHSHTRTRRHTQQISTDSAPAFIHTLRSCKIVRLVYLFDTFPEPCIDRITAPTLGHLSD